MARVKRAQGRSAGKKAFKKATKGYRGGRARYRQAHEALMKAQKYAFIGRKLKKRDFRGLWIIRINAALMGSGISYSKFIFGLKKAGIELNRKTLADLAIQDPNGFNAIVEQAKAALA